MTSTPKPAILPETEWQALVESHSKLAYAEAHRAFPMFMNMEFEDLLMEAQLALIKAARSYDPNRKSEKTGKSVKFITLAVTSIRNHISGLRSHGLQLKRYGYCKSMSVQDLNELVDHRPGPSPEDNDELEYLRDLIDSDLLTKEERKVISLVASGLSIKKVAKKLRMNTMVVSQLRDAAIGKLREFVQEGQDDYRIESEAPEE